MYQQAVTRLTAAADQVADYRADLAAFADTLDGKRWGAEVTGPIKDMTGQLVALEGDYRDLADRMLHQGDQGAAAHEQAPWVPDTLLHDEAIPAVPTAALGTAAGSPDHHVPGHTAWGYVDTEQGERPAYINPAGELYYSPASDARWTTPPEDVARTFRPKRAHYVDNRGVPLVDMAQPNNNPETNNEAVFTPTPFEAPSPEVLETGPFAQHKLPDPGEDQEFRDMIAEYFDPMQDKDPRSLKATLDNAPDDLRDAWTRRADEIARAWGSSLHGPGSLFEYIEPADAGTDSEQQPAAGESTTGTEPAQDDVQEPVTAIPPVPAPVSGWPSNKPLAKNDWGGFEPDATVHYHDDGPIGTAISYMGRRDAQMDVDGEPLANVLGKVATDVVRGRRTAQQAVDDLKVLCDRLPEASQARAWLGRAIEQMDAPVTPVPAVPDGTPEPLRDLVQALHAVPLVRKEPEKELEPLLKLIEDLAGGRVRERWLAEEVRNLRNKRHESYGDAGKFEIDRAIDAAYTALREQRR